MAISSGNINHSEATDSIKQEARDWQAIERKPWRPKEWDVSEIRLQTHEVGKFADNDLVEAGADAMLEALEPLIRRIAPSSKLVDILYPKE